MSDDNEVPVILSGPSDGRVTVVIGGQSRTLPHMTFAQLKAATPHIDAVAAGGNRIKLTDAALTIVAIMDPDGGDQAALAGRLLVTEMQGVLEALTQLLRISGLVQEAQPPGEAQAIG